VNYHDQVVQEYKALIRQQDDELQKVKAELQTLSKSREHETVAKHATTEQQLVVTQQKLEETLSKLARLETSSSLTETGDVVSSVGKLQRDIYRPGSTVVDAFCELNQTKLHDCDGLFCRGSRRAFGSTC